MAECEVRATGTASRGAAAPIFFVAKKAFRKCVPFTAVLELTYRCNFRCSMCYVIHENTEGELTTAEWKDVLDQLAEAGTMYLELTGGEIFVRRDLWEILEYAEKKKFLVVLFTNGSYITPEKAERLRRFKNIVGFSISLYGGDKQTFDKVTRVRNAYDRVLQALGVLRDHGFRVKTKTPVTTENVHTLEQMRGVAKAAGCMQYVCAPLISPRDDGGLDPLKERVGDEEIRDIYRRESMEWFDTKKVSWSSPTCTAGRSLVGISPQGDVYPCIQLRRSAGNLREKPFKELWNSHALDEVRAFNFSKMEKCQSCSVTTFCSPCIGLNLMENGDIHKPSSETCRITTLSAEVYREQKRLPMVATGGVREVAHCALG
jgi:radical SAM protein with 4Fe4S-binding SPASM domain